MFSSTMLSLAFASSSWTCFSAAFSLAALAPPPAATGAPPTGVPRPAGFFTAAAALGVTFAAGLVWIFEGTFFTADGRLYLLVGAIGTHNVIQADLRMH